MKNSAIPGRIQNNNAAIIIPNTIRPIRPPLQYVDTGNPKNLSVYYFNSALNLAVRAGNHLENIANNAIIGNLKDRRVLIAVHRHNRARGLHPDNMLNRAGNTAGDIQLGIDSFAGMSDPAGNIQSSRHQQQRVKRPQPH